MPARSRSVAVSTLLATVLAAGALIAARSGPTEARLQITYPLEGTLFPPESVAPTFVWEDGNGGASHWDVVVRDDTGGEGGE